MCNQRIICTDPIYWLKWKRFYSKNGIQVKCTFLSKSNELGRNSENWEQISSYTITRKSKGSTGYSECRDGFLSCTIYSKWGSTRPQPINTETFTRIVAGQGWRRPLLTMEVASGVNMKYIHIKEKSCFYFCKFFREVVSLWKSTATSHHMRKMGIPYKD